MTCIEIAVEVHLLAESYVPLHSSGFPMHPNGYKSHTTSPDEIHMNEAHDQIRNIEKKNIYHLRKLPNNRTKRK